MPNSNARANQPHCTIATTQAKGTEMSARYFLAPSGIEIASAVDITDYVTTDGVQFEHELDPVIEAFRASYEHSVEFTSNDLQELAKAMSAHAFEQKERRQRAMNTTIQYPTSNPAWARKRK